MSFGHPLSALVATLGINPSSGEFLGRDRRLLSGADRRLATLDSLGITKYTQMDEGRAAQVVDDCADYFGRRPYRWFTPLDRILRSALGTSYFDATACHLDLVQWATDPVWGELDDVARVRLLADDRSFLMQQLRAEHYKVVVVNGRTALRWVSRAGITKWQDLARLTGRPTATVCVGDTSTPLFIGWSCNLQSQPGAMRHADAIADIVKTLAIEERNHRGESTMETDTSLARGTHARTGTELVSLLTTWLAESTDETIGDVSRFPRAPWISVETPSVSWTSTPTHADQPSVRSSTMSGYSKGHSSCTWWLTAEAVSTRSSLIRQNRHRLAGTRTCERRSPRPRR